MDIQLRDDFALAVFATLVGDVADAVEHQHAGQGQASVAGAEQLTAGTGQQVVVGIGGFLIRIRGVHVICAQTGYSTQAGLVPNIHCFHSVWNGSSPIRSNPPVIVYGCKMTF